MTRMSLRFVPLLGLLFAVACSDSTESAAGGGASSGGPNDGTDQGDGGTTGDGGGPSGDAAPNPSDPGSARAYHVGNYTGAAGEYVVVLTPAKGASTPLQLGAFKPGPYVGVSPDQKKLAAL